MKYIISFFLKIYTILVLIFNVIVRRSRYTLSFVKDDDGVWYYNFKGWGFAKYHLTMVSGADAMCEVMSKDSKEAKVDIIASKNRLPSDKIAGYQEWVADDRFEHETFIDDIIRGRTYTKLWVDDNGTSRVQVFWICPVTLFVLGRYPNFLYLKAHGESKEAI